MSFLLRLSLALLIAAAAVFASPPAFAQSGDTKSGDKPAAAQPADPAKDAQRQVDEFAEATRLVTGPAGNPECVWLGRRVVGLMWRDDMDTAFRHLDLYDRFGCPGPHIQAAFRCVVRQGNNIDPKIAPEPQCPGAFLLANPTASQATAAAPPPRPRLRRDRPRCRRRPRRHKIQRPRRPPPEPQTKKRVSRRGDHGTGVRHQFAITLKV